jgi:hypothetical protein
MNSDSDDLEEQLRANLKLRTELATEVAKAKDSSTSQRVSRGSHRLGLLLASILFVIGLAFVVADIVHLRLWDIKLSDLPVVLGGVLIGLLGLTLACLAVYGIVRAVG